MASVPVYRGRFGVREAERLLWRAGFGPRKGEARRVASLGLDGAVRWLLATSELLTDSSGRPAAVFGAVRDVTEQKLAEESMKKK